MSEIYMYNFVWNILDKTKAGLNDYEIQPSRCMKKTIAEWINCVKLAITFICFTPIWFFGLIL